MSTATANISADIEVEKRALLLDAQELVFQAMEDKGVTKADLARLLDTSPANVTQLLSGDRNMTLNTLAEVLYVLGFKVELGAKRLARLHYTNGEAASA